MNHSTHVKSCVFGRASPWKVTIFTNYMSDRGLVYRVYKELKELNLKKTNGYNLSRIL